MNIKVKNVSHYKNVSLKYDDGTIDLGLLNKEEAVGMAIELLDAAYYLLPLESLKEAEKIIKIMENL